MKLFQCASSASQSSHERLSSADTLVELESHPDPLTQLASKVENIKFSTYQSLYQTIKRRHQSLIEKSLDQYLVFSSMSQEQASRLSQDGSAVSKFCRFAHNIETGILIVKIMPLNAQERLS